VTRNNVISYPGTVLDEGRYENMFHDMKHIVVLPYVEIRDTVCEIVKEDKKWDVTHKYLTDVYEQGCRTRQFVVNDRVYTEEQCTFVLNKLVKVYTRRKDHLFKVVNVIFGVVLQKKSKVCKNRGIDEECLHLVHRRPPHPYRPYQRTTIEQYQI
jgi:hypothetical protein